MDIILHSGGQDISCYVCQSNCAYPFYPRDAKIAKGCTACGKKATELCKTTLKDNFTIKTFSLTKYLNRCYINLCLHA